MVVQHAVQLGIHSSHDIQENVLSRNRIYLIIYCNQPFVVLVLVRLLYELVYVFL